MSGLLWFLAGGFIGSALTFAGMMLMFIMGAVDDGDTRRG